jgi:hypothetical protein
LTAIDARPVRVEDNQMIVDVLVVKAPMWRGCAASLPLCLEARPTYRYHCNPDAGLEETTGGDRFGSRAH